MKLLVITQTVDTTDTTLGFFSHWIEEFAKRFEHVDVVCLKKGKYSFPENIHVFSLGKEKKVSKISYILNFYMYIWRERNNYDAVFVHMNQEYVLLGGLFWKLFGKKIFFWRNHPQGSFLTDIAVSLSDKVFCTSKDSYTARCKKTSIMPAGIDMHMFEKSAGVERTPRSLLMFGRIAPIKRVEVAIDALAILKSTGVVCTLTIVGDAKPTDENYMIMLKDKVEKLGMTDCVHFKNGVAFSQAPQVYQSHDVFLNFTPSGSFDKTVIEALASGCKVITSNTSMRDILPTGSYIDDTPVRIAEHIQHMLGLTDTEMHVYAEEAKITVRSQSLETLMDRLMHMISI